MRISETLKLNGRQKIVIDTETLAAINAANSTADFDNPSKVFAVEAVIIDSEVTRNGNEYPPDWQAAMKEKWIGTPMVYSEEDHQPNAPDHVGWIYATEIEESSDRTATVAQFAIPIIADTERLVERFRAGLNHSVSIAVETSTDGVVETEEGIRRLVGESAPIHVALVGDPGSRRAGIRATSESVRIEEKLQRLDDATALLVADAKRIREPIIQEAVKYARLSDSTVNPTVLRERFERWTLAEIEAYRNTQRDQFNSKHPNASRQMAQGGDGEEPKAAPPVTWKTLEEITKANKPE